MGAALAICSCAGAVFRVAGSRSVLVRPEEMHLVPDDRAAARAADLLVLVRQHLVRDRIRRVELVAAEEAVDAAGGFVGPRAGDRLHLDAHRSALGDVELRGDLELRNRLAAEPRLAEARPGNLLRDLLPVQFDLEGIVAADARLVGDVVGGDALHQLRQLHPVATLQRQFFHLPPIDVARHLRRRGVDERCFADDCQRFADLREFHRHGNCERIAHEQLDVLQDDARESRKLGLDGVLTRREPQQAVLALLVGDGRGNESRFLVRGRDVDAGQDRFRVVDRRADDRTVLRTGHRRDETQQNDQNRHA